MKNITFVILLLSLFENTFLARAEDSTKIAWPAGKSAVAWMTKKRMFLVSTVEPVGINSDLSIKTQKLEKSLAFTISAPLNKFDSGEPKRDHEVMNILKAEQQADLIFTSSPISEETLKSFETATQAFDISGELKIANKSYPVTFSAQKKNEDAGAVLEGRLHTHFTSFTSFNIDPPSVVGGLVANVKDDLTLLFHVYLKELK